MELVFFSSLAPLQSWWGVCKHQDHIPLESILLNRSRLEVVNSAQTNCQQYADIDPFLQNGVQMSSYDIDYKLPNHALSCGCILNSESFKTSSL